MDLEQRLRASMAAPKPGPMFTAKVLARIARGATRRRSRVVLVGTVLAVAAAAALLVWQMSDVQGPRVESAANAVAPGPAAVAQDPAVQSESAVKEPAASAASPEPVPANVARQFSVLVLPLRQETQNLAGRAPVQALYAAMLEELRKVPGLTLRVPGESASAAGGRADYVLTIASLATNVTQSGGVVMRSLDGNTRCTENGGPEIFCGTNPLGVTQRPRGIRMDMDYDSEGRISVFNGASLDSPDGVVWVEMKVESPQLAASQYTWPVGVEGPADQLGCSGSSGPRTPECMTPAQLAARQVRSLRLQVFPPDAAYQQQVLAQLGSSQDPTAGLLLSELLQGLARGGGSRLDNATIQALARYLRGQPASTRASAWMALRQVSHPALIAPLVEALRHDTDRGVRLTALESLEVNYSTDPAVRSAFESIDRGDPDSVVRAKVRRALFGPAQWRDDVLATLPNTDLPYEARLAPLMAGSSTVSTQQEGNWRSVMQEQQVLQPLMALIRENLRDPDHAQTTGDALNLLTSVEDPVVFDLFLQLAREKGLPFLVSGTVRNWAFDHRNDARVREILPLAEPAGPSGLQDRLRAIMGSGSITREEAAAAGSGTIRLTPPR